MRGGVERLGRRGRAAPRAAAGSRWLDFAAAALVVCAIGGAYARTLAPGLTWANDGADGGDLIAAAATFGVAHPTGYPTYLLLARLFQQIPLGDLAFRVNLLSAAAASGAALCVYHLTRGLLERGGWRATVAAAGAALALGFSAVFWSQAVVAEVYSLHGLFTALILLFAVQSVRASRPPAERGPQTQTSLGHLALGVPTSAWPSALRATWLQGLIAGLALGSHITIAAVVVVWLLVAGMHDPAPERARRLAWRGCWMSLGALVYLYLPLRAAAHPPINWGDPHSWEGFWWTISGSPYRELAFGLPRAFLYGRLEAWAALLAQQFGWLGIGLGFVGLIYGAATARQFVWLTCGLVIALSAFALAYDTADSYTYLLPTYIIFAIWIGLGLHVALETLASRRAAAPLAAAALVIALLWRAPATALQVDASGDRRAIDFATHALAAAPPRALVITASDRDTFALWYYHYALGDRPDIVVIAEPLLDFAWYRDNLRATYPTLNLPEHADAGWTQALAAANPERGPICHTDAEDLTPLRCDSSASVVSSRP